MARPSVRRDTRRRHRRSRSLRSRSPGRRRGRSARPAALLDSPHRSPQSRRRSSRRSRSRRNIRRGEAKPEGCRTIWVGWVPDRPSEDDIIEFFKDCGGVTDVRISDHQVRGYFAHVQFEDTSCVDEATKKQGESFMGRRIEIDYAYMDKVMTNPQREANAPGRILHCKPKSTKPPGGRTLWLGDLSIDTSEQDVVELFQPCGQIEMICLKVNQLRNGHFGHVKFYDTEAVDKAAQMAGTLLKGVPIRMDYAEDKPLEAYRAGKGESEKKRPEGCQTIFVGGLPGDVSEDMIRILFERCGETVEIRLGQSKRSGAQFCHIEFAEEAAVDRAIRLSGEQLGGSKIRVDFAENRRRPPPGPAPPPPPMPPVPPPWMWPGPPPGSWMGCQGPPGAWLGPGGPDERAPGPLGPPGPPPPGPPPFGWPGWDPYGRPLWDPRPDMGDWRPPYAYGECPKPRSRSRSSGSYSYSYSYTPSPSRSPRKS